MVSLDVDFGEALAACQAMFDATDAVPPPRHAPVLVIENVFDRAPCDALMGLWDAGQKLDNTVAVGAGEAGRADTSLKRRSDVHVAERFGEGSTQDSNRLKRQYLGIELPIAATRGASPHDHG